MARRLVRFLVSMHEPHEWRVVERVSNKGEPWLWFLLHAALRLAAPEVQRVFGLSVL
ncbi:hypothetical protein [Mumia zhuanghuii]|uniref:hypothetical protein n=1 Tax=Mumia zhuanghuii TaxID=2585211 RepID=UPI00129CF539|nr:hypothetical protein [Mumia zhuanghuii]